MSFEPREYLRHILVEVEFLQGSCSGLSTEDFLADETLRRVAVRSLEIIGEAARKVPEDFRAQYPAIEWRAMSGMRNRLIHDYFGVDYELVWDVVQNCIPILRSQIAQADTKPRAINSMTIEDGLVVEMVKVRSMRGESTTPDGARKRLPQLNFTVRRHIAT